MLKRGFEAERAVVAAFASCKKPSDAEFQALLAPIAKEMEAAQGKTRGRRSAEDNHYKAVAEAMGALSWVCYQPGAGLSLPPQHVEESYQGAEFYSNKVLMEYRQSDPRQVEWTKAVKAVFTELKAFTKKYFSTGIKWNESGVALSAFDGTAPAAGKKKAPPAAPPPPPPGYLQEKAQAGAKPKQPAEGMSAVFSELAKGDGVTAGLRKVTDDMKVKNRADRSGKVTASGPPASDRAPAPAAAKAARPAKTELQNNRKWAVENYRGDRNIVLEVSNPKHGVYLYNCEDCTVQIKGKVNAVSVDKCKRTGVLFDDVVAACEVVNSSGMQMQVTGKCASFQFDKCDGVQLFMSSESLAAEVLTAKCSEINVSTPGASADDEPIEHALPEQFVSRFTNGKFITEPVCHSAG